ncbi:response regulator [Desulfosarcina sp. OttesenSCG-928-A07]|nr:response regulator [Desulfosarcina sp. OttesenSCG-928-A07]
MNPPRPLVLIVDDNTTNIDLLVSTLKSDYRLGIAKNGEKALEYVKKQRPDIVLLDIMMPGMDGYEVCQSLKADPETTAIPIIFITAMNEVTNKTRGFELGAVDYITKPFQAAEVKARIRMHLSIEEMRLELASQNERLEALVSKKTREIQTVFDASICSMATMVEVRDPYTAGHQLRVSQLACAIAEKLELDPDTIEGIRIAGLLHDVGKIRVPVSILSRAGKLLDAEYEMLKIHPQVGFDILTTIPFPWPVAEIVFQHHERLDGTGYPRGLSENQILLETKILTVADVTEAYSSFRPYRPARGIDMAISELVQHRGTHYDPKVVDVCLELFKTGQFIFDSFDNTIPRSLPDRDKI